MRIYQPKNILFFCLLCVFPALVGFQTSQPTSSFVDAPAIWSHNGTPANHEVVLFRRAFTLEQDVHAADLSIFADTRYEVWLDGTWLGRGPARFSRQIREYDTYDVAHLHAGYHVLAVLVQWAPEGRRVDSVTPYLQAQLSHTDALWGQQTLLSTDTDWRAWSATAWRQDVQWLNPHHRLIGPTELLDFAQLPVQWNESVYNQDHWPAAVIKEKPQAHTVQPRSIPPLVNLPVPYKVYDQGYISEGWRFHELVPTDEPIHTLIVNTPSENGTATLQIEVLASDTVSPVRDVQLVGTPIVWRSLNQTRPDVFQGAVTLPAGAHTLSLMTGPYLDEAETPLPDTGFTLAMRTLTADVTMTTSLPDIRQGVHSGRRNLLADFTSQDAVDIRAAGDVTETNMIFATSPTYLVLDLGRVLHGRVMADVEGPSGSIVDIGWDERLWKDGSTPRPLAHHGRLNDGWNQIDSWVLDGTAQTLTTIDSRAGRYILITVWPSTDNAAEPVKIHNFQVMEERYPLTPIGSFHTQDSLLEKIWQTGVDTLYANMTDAYADPFRERGQWWGDAFVAYHMNRVVFGDQQLFRRGIRFFPEYIEAGNGRPAAFAPGFDNVSRPLDYGMLWVISAAQYAQLTDDHALLHEIYPAMGDFLSHLASRQNAVTGLLETPIAHWHESAVIGWGAYYSRWGQSTVLNSFYHATLNAAAQIATIVGDTAQANVWQMQADTIAAQLNATLYLPDKGHYAVTRLNDIIQEEETIYLTPHAQAWPLAYDLVPNGHVDTVVKAALNTTSLDPSEIRIQIYEMFWLLEALGKTNRLAEALTIIDTHYGPPLALGATTWWESFGVQDNYRASLSHAWGGAPTWFLSTYVLGTLQLSPTTWQVTPGFASGLNEVHGAIPLNSAIHEMRIGERVDAMNVLGVRWQQAPCVANTRQRSVTIDAPAGTEGVLRLVDLASAMEIRLNQSVIWQDGVSQAAFAVAYGDDIYVQLTDGHHSVEIVEYCYASYLPLTIK
ncbi:MAG: family 78 glycoside hydrolase catalytic domain [Chloroflexota bacterium]